MNHIINPRPGHQTHHIQHAIDQAITSGETAYLRPALRWARDTTASTQCKVVPLLIIGILAITIIVWSAITD